MKKIHIDLETYSSADLAKTGVYKYCESPDFEILLFGYSVDGGEVKVVDLARGEKIPEEIIDGIRSDDVIKIAHNANFERVCLSRHLNISYLNPASWRCTMVWSAYLGLPLSLKGVGSVLGLDKQKMEEGKELIRFFCVPRTPTKTNPSPRNTPITAPEKWELFKSYNKRDVEVEMEIEEKLTMFPVPDFVWEEYFIDQEINDRGVLIDEVLVDSAIEMDRVSKEDLKAKMARLTELENPNSVKQLTTWLGEMGVEADSLGKKDVKKMIDSADGEIKEVLLLRQQLAKSSVKKYQAMKNAVCADGRVRGMFQFYGANRTGRFSGKIVQMQNLRRNDLNDLDVARDLVKSGNMEAVELLFSDVPDTLSQLIRTAFIPRQGDLFYVADFSAIEARVLSWLAGEQWRLDVFENGGDIYCATASKMFGVPVVKHGENGELRQKGKQAELACIAEGSLVLTDCGLVNIEKVTTQMKVWDGENWVEHEGVVFRGEKEVLTFEGLTATPDHLVFTEDLSYPVEFGYAIKEGLRLRRVEDWNGERFPFKGVKRVYDIRNAGPNHRFVVSGVLVHNCGYGGGVGAMIAMGAIEAGMKEEELQPLVDAWRQASPNIVKLWYAFDRAAKKAIKERTTTDVRGIRFSYISGFLFMRLPSGRSLAYVKPRIGENRFGGESITYEGVGEDKKWKRLETFGGKLVENCVQAISRDILCNSMRNLQNERICMHIHDELVIECKEGTDLEEICSRMGQAPSWAQGLTLRADGYTCTTYRKD